MFDIIKCPVALVAESFSGFSGRNPNLSKALGLTYNTKKIKLNKQNKIK